MEGLESITIHQHPEGYVELRFTVGDLHVAENFITGGLDEPPYVVWKLRRLATRLEKLILEGSIR